MGAGADADDTTPSVEELRDRLDGDVIPVSQLNSDISTLIDSADLHFDYVVGDCSDRYEAQSGHLHLDLVHEDCTIHCLVLSYRRDSLTDDPQEDAHIAVRGDLSYYEAEGGMTIFVSDIVEVGDGHYEAIYRENRETLEADGLLADEAKQSLPEYPAKIGLATSSESDAREDAVQSIHDRNPDVDIVVQDCTVQGDNALPSLLESVSKLERDSTVDVIVVTRGGGADKHLRVFNELPLCRVLSRTETPLVAAIGHENDRVLAGEVADERAMTPTDIGSTVIPHSKADLRDERMTAATRLDRAYTRHVDDRLTGVRDDLDTAYTHTVTDRLATARSELDMALEKRASTQLTDLRNQLDHSFETFKQQVEHESEKEDAVAEAKAEAKDEVEGEVREEFADQQRRQRIAILLLILLVLLLGAYLITQV